jgi:hypothetical protein
MQKNNLVTKIFIICRKKKTKNNEWCYSQGGSLKDFEEFLQRQQAKISVKDFKQSRRDRISINT